MLLWNVKDTFCFTLLNCSYKNNYSKSQILLIVEEPFMNYTIFYVNVQWANIRNIKEIYDMIVWYDSFSQKDIYSKNYIFCWSCVPALTYFFTEIV